MSYLKSILQFILFVLFLISFTLTLFEIFGIPSSFGFLNKQGQKKERSFDEFDPSLSFINSMSRLENYVNILYKQGNYAANDPAAYAELASDVVKKRFYHGVSRYGAGRNYIAAVTASFTDTDVDAIVLPDDILKYPYALCSQQSLVLMKLLRRKGYDYRKVGFYSKETRSGHYAFEIKYNNKWHFFDPDMEPDAQLLNKYNRPGIAELVDDKKLLLNSYRYWNKNQIIKLFPTYFYGETDAPIAQRATFFQKMAYGLSYSLWLFFLVSFVCVTRLIPSRKERFIAQPSWAFSIAKFK